VEVETARQKADEAKRQAEAAIAAEDAYHEEVVAGRRGTTPSRSSRFARPQRLPARS